MKRGAVLVPGYGGDVEQPIVVALGRALREIDVEAQPIAFSTGGRRPSRDYRTELSELAAARDRLRDRGNERVALVGRSFGGRMCVFLAARETADALVVLGYPISPPNRPRPDDEAALAAVACPTLVVQGSRDALGPLAVLERIAGQNPRVDLVVLRDVGHSFGRHTAEAIAHAVRWLDATLR